MRTMHVSLVQRPAKTQNFTKLNNTVCSRFIHPDTVRHHTFSKNAMASSGCQSRTIKSQHHAQESPCYLTEGFGMVSQVHDVETRHRTLYVFLPSTGRNGYEAFKFNGIKSWNKLSLKIKKLNLLSSFKQAVKRHMIDKLVNEYKSDFL